MKTDQAGEDSLEKAPHDRPGQEVKRMSSLTSIRPMHGVLNMIIYFIIFLIYVVSMPSCSANILRLISSNRFCYSNMV